MEVDAPGSTGRDKRGNFVRLAEKRTVSILNRIRILGNLSNKSVYEFTEDDIDEIFNAIQQELDLARAKFVATHRRRPDFRLSRGDDR